MNKTIAKLKTICAPHGVEIEATQDDWLDWRVVFDAPPKMAWNSSTCTVVVWDQATLRGVVGFIRHELASGFSPASESALQETGQ